MTSIRHQILKILDLNPMSRGQLVEHFGLNAGTEEYKQFVNTLSDLETPRRGSPAQLSQSIDRRLSPDEGALYHRDTFVIYRKDQEGVLQEMGTISRLKEQPSDLLNVAGELGIRPTHEQFLSMLRKSLTGKKEG